MHHQEGVANTRGCFGTVFTVAVGRLPRGQTKQTVANVGRCHVEASSERALELTLVAKSKVVANIGNTSFLGLTQGAERRLKPAFTNTLLDTASPFEKTVQVRTRDVKLPLQGCHSQFGIAKLTFNMGKDAPLEAFCVQLNVLLSGRCIQASMQNSQCGPGQNGRILPPASGHRLQKMQKMLRQYSTWQTIPAENEPMDGSVRATYSLPGHQKTDVVAVSDTYIRRLGQITEIDVTFIETYNPRPSKAPLDVTTTRQSDQHAIREITMFDKAVVPHISRRTGVAASDHDMVQLVHGYRRIHRFVVNGMDVRERMNPSTVRGCPESGLQ